MELLTIKHQDFTMSIECSKFDAIWQKAASNVGVENLTSSYSWSEGVLSVVRMDEEGHKIAFLLGMMRQQYSLIMQNTQYGLSSKIM